MTTIYFNLLFLFLVKTVGKNIFRFVMTFNNYNKNNTIVLYSCSAANFTCWQSSIKGWGVYQR